MTTLDAQQRPQPTSPRLVFRELAPGDVAAFHSLAIDAHVRRYLLDGQIVSREWAAEAVASSARTFAERGLGTRTGASQSPLSRR